MMIRHGTCDSAGVVCVAYFGQVTRCESLNRHVLRVVEEVTFRGASDRALHHMVLGCRNSDTRHGSQQCILLNGLAHAPLELVQVHVPRLLHNFTHSRLALLQRLQRLIFR